MSVPLTMTISEQSAHQKNKFESQKLDQKIDNISFEQTCARTKLKEEIRLVRQALQEIRMTTGSIDPNLIDLTDEEDLDKSSKSKGKRKKRDSEVFPAVDKIISVSKGFIVTNKDTMQERTKLADLAVLDKMKRGKTLPNMPTIHTGEHTKKKMDTTLSTPGLKTEANKDELPVGYNLQHIDDKFRWEILPTPRQRRRSMSMLSEGSVKDLKLPLNPRRIRKLREKMVVANNPRNSHACHFEQARMRTLEKRIQTFIDEVTETLTPMPGREQSNVHRETSMAQSRRGHEDFSDFEFDSDEIEDDDDI